MRIQRPLAPLLALALFSCESGQEDALTSTDRTLQARPPAHAVNVLDFDIVNRTCALYVAVRSSAWQETIAFGRELDDSMVRWNVCPGGNMVACAVAPTANGDSVITGIPWSYAASKGY